MANDLAQRMRLAAALGGKGGSGDVTPITGTLRRTTGTATADSSDGKVTVQLAGGDPIEVPTAAKVKQGDTVSLLVADGVATNATVAGWGDSMQKQVDETKAEVDDHEKLIADVKKDVADYKATASATYATKTEVDDKTGAITKTLEADYKTWDDTQNIINDNYVGIGSFNNTIREAEQFVAQTYAEKTELTEAVNQLTSTMSSNYTAFTDYRASNDKAVADAKAAGTTAQSNLESYQSTNDAAVAELKNIADNAIESWQEEGAPTTTNKPASYWTTDALKKQHTGDLYMDTDTGYSYRWSGTAWVQVKDSDITKALKEVETVKTTYATKSELSATDTELRGKVSDALTTAKSYTDSSITTEAVNRDAAIKAQADSISLEVSKTYAKQETFDSYKNSNDETVSNIKTTADSAASDLAEYKTSVSETYATKASLTATDSSIRSDVSSTYLSKGDASSTYATSTSLTQTASDLTTTIRTAQDTANGAASVANTTATMIRQYAGGVLVAKTGAAVGALVNANGSFDVVSLTWSDGVPSVSGTPSSFDTDSVNLLGGAARFYVKQWSENPKSREVRINSPDGAVITLGVDDEATNGGLYVIPENSPMGSGMGGEAGCEWPFYADNLHAYELYIKNRSVAWQSASVTLNTSSSLLGSHSASCLINSGLGLAYLAVDMSFESPGWQPGTGTWVLRLPEELRPAKTVRLSNIIQIYIGGRWGAHLDVHSDGYCCPTWGWQATNIMCATVFPLALLGL